MIKVLIRPLRLEDASISWKWRNDPEVWKYTGRKPDIIVSEEIEKKWLLEKLKETDSARFAIEVDDVYVGNIQLTDIVKNESAEYHIFIGNKAYWGKGIAALATTQILRFAKNVINLKSIYLYVKHENVSAIKVYERVGFKKLNDSVKMSLHLYEVNSPVVNIFMMAYNHEKYISDAIESILVQKTDFDYEILIGEDCSTDNTRRIILEFQQKHPGKFKLLLHEKNIGAIANQMAVLNACTSKYIALCEGDDYWTDPNKLQKQVDFLEAHPSYSLCFHNAEYKFENTGKHNQLFNPDKIKSIYDLKDTIECTTWYVPTPSIVFRREMLELPSWLRYVQQGDKALQLILATKGKFYYMDEVMCVYRKHATSIGAITEESKTKLRQIQMYSYFNMHTNFINADSIDLKIGYLISGIEKAIIFETKLNLIMLLRNWYNLNFKKQIFKYLRKK